MTREELLDRAWSARGLPIKYRLGAGAPPAHASPAGEDGCCDCSGFVAWAFGYNRFQPNYGFLVKLNGGWMNTDGIVEDSRNSTGLYEPWSTVIDPKLLKASDVLVYPSAAYARNKLHVIPRIPSSGMPTIGHVGIITQIKKSGAKLLHCSAGNVRKYGHAIEETGAEPFLAVSYARAVIFGGVLA